MKQALHIFRKDIRYLRLEIAGLLFLTVVFALFGGAGWPGDALEIAALYVVARLIHAETIPGDRQFWLTRPYRSMSLCGAKLLFIVVFICLPIGIAQAAIAVKMGFPLMQEIPGLIWTQMLIFFVGALPVVALAAVTEGLVPFTAMVLTLVVIAILGATTLPALFPRLFTTVPPTVEWMGSSVFGVAIGWVAATVVLWQYRDRRTLFSRLFGVIAFNVAMLFYLCLPPSLPLAAETWFSKEPGLAGPVRVSVAPDRRRSAADVPGGKENSLRIPLPLLVSGLPAEVETRSDNLSVSFAWPDRTWAPTTKPGVASHSTGRGEAVLDALIRMDSALFAERRNSPVTIRGSVYLTLFGEAESRKISLRRGPVNVQDGLQCYTSEFAGEVSQMLCRSFFRWPSRLVYAEGNNDVSDFSNSIISYSPFPAGLNLNPVEVRWAEPIHADEATIVTKRPLVHFRREFELSGIRLADFEKKPRAEKLPGMP